MSIMNSGSAPRLLQGDQKAVSPSKSMSIKCGTCGLEMKTNQVQAHMKSHIAVIPTKE